MATTSTEVPRHPARYHPLVLREAAELIAGEPDLDPKHHDFLVLDPFAGTGGIHRLPEVLHDAGFVAASTRTRTLGLELEPDWAAAHDDTIVGDVLAMPIAWEDRFAALVTSPCYGNRMADKHDAKDDSRRNTYRHALGHPLVDGSAAGIQWGPEYRRFHTAAWSACLDVIRPGGLAVINVKNHIRGGEVMRVAEWHLSTWLALGCTIERVAPIETAGLGFGENWDARIPYELVMAFRVPDPKPERRLA